MKRKTFVSIFVLVLALIWMAVGIYRGELSAVWGKAVTVCLECIGLG